MICVWGWPFESDVLTEFEIGVTIGVVTALVEVEAVVIVVEQNGSTWNEPFIGKANEFVCCCLTAGICPTFLASEPHTILVTFVVNVDVTITLSFAGKVTFAIAVKLFALFVGSEGV